MAWHTLLRRLRQTLAQVKLCPDHRPHPVHVPFFPDRRHPLARAAIALLALIGLAKAQADVGSSSSDWLLPSQVYGSSQWLPGDRWEGRLTGERSLLLPGMEWQTSTDLSRTRFEQMFPVRAQGVKLSTGPKIRIGAAELSLPWITGRDTYSVGGTSTWSGSAPRMTLALGSNDRVRLEAKVSRRKDSAMTQRRRSASLSWRHSFSDDWSLTAGLRQVYESGGTDTRLTAETYASVDARLDSGWRWSLASSLSDLRQTGTTGLQASQRDRSASLSLSTRYRLADGWWVSSELKSTQTYHGDEQRAAANHSGEMKLYRDF